LTKYFNTTIENISVKNKWIK